MATETQISAFISPTTRDLLEEFVRETGVKKSFVLEQALLHHLRALKEIPADVLIPPRIVVTRASMDRVSARLRRGRPTAALRALMSRRGD